MEHKIYTEYQLNMDYPTFLCILGFEPKRFLIEKDVLHKCQSSPFFLKRWNHMKEYCKYDSNNSDILTEHLMCSLYLQKYFSRPKQD
jgi:hypothetical protein